ncbi:SF1B family DNA helicase RecD2 [Desulfobacter curvatus]|uniref:SF1B family DNA helicase RecD2 n=1 Tax=Desulfobacter curvatus TaxID=2290 RepID=UPI000374DB2A|nr:AAA family ATPase [Desulfobacter curvatus]
MNQHKQPHYRIHGTVTKIVSHNTNTGYTLLQIKEPAPKRRTISIITHLPACHIGVSMSFRGDWRFEGTPIFYAEYAYEQLPKTPTAIKKYLNSGIINGVGHSTVKKIVNHFQKRTIDVLNDPNAMTALTEVPGLSTKKISLLLDSWYQHNITTDIMLFLQRHGLTCSHAVKAYAIYGGFTQGKMQENPYRLLEDLDDIRFPDVDPFALSIGIAPDNEDRIQAAISYLLTNCQNLGHCYLTVLQISRYLKKVWGIDVSENLNNILTDMEQQQFVKSHLLAPPNKLPQPCYYESSIYEEEQYVAQKISRNNIPPEVDLDWIKDLVKRYQVQEFQLSEEQKDAAIGAVCSKYSVISGGAGTGKSATLKLIVYILKTLALTFHLVAPTGRAAQRLSEITGENVQTIHRLLGCKSEKFYQYNENNRIKTDFVIIDESSMLDIRLLAALLHAIPDSTQVLFVGDHYQLPSIGPGNILRDLIDSKAVNVYQLTKVFRQTENSLILHHAYQIRSGFSAKYILSEINGIKMSEQFCDCYFFFTKEAGCQELNDTAINHVKTRRSYMWEKPDLMKRDQAPNVIKPGYSASEFICQLYKTLKSEKDASEIQVLTPMNHSASQINQKVQDIINPYDKSKPQLKIENKLFRVGDRVIHCKNNYDLGVFNGDIGTIVNIGVNRSDHHSICTVAYPGERLVGYNHDDIKELDLAYAITIHKSQGSEFDAVIIYVSEQDRKVSRNLLYTALTRAKQLVVLVGYVGKFTSKEFRQTGLKDMLAS